MTDAPRFPELALFALQGVLADAGQHVSADVIRQAIQARADELELNRSQLAHLRGLVASTLTALEDDQSSCRGDRCIWRDDLLDALKPLRAALADVSPVVHNTRIEP